MDQTPNLGLDYLLPGQAQRHVTVNDNTRALDAIVHICAESRTETSPPAMPIEGLTYIPAPPAAGHWTGCENEIVTFQDGAWAARAPKTGWTAWVRDEALLVVFEGGAWRAAVQTDEVDMLGVGTAADPANVLTISGASSLFANPGGSHRLAISRSADAETASVIFQSAYIGQAEIGLLGTTGLSIKVAADLAAAPAAITISPESGRTGLGTASPSTRLHLFDQIDARLMIETATSGSGGGFDILNSGSGQRWRVTGQTDLFKVRDHTGAIDKLTIMGGPSGEVRLENCGNVGVGIASPTVRLHVDGMIRTGAVAIATLADPVAAGSGSLVFVSDAPGGGRFAYSDGAIWRWVNTGASVS